MKANFAPSLAFVWGPGRDSPLDGYHITPDDPGKGTKGGITENTWTAAVKGGVTIGTLMKASDGQLEQVLRTLFWGRVCEAMPHGVDLLFFNGIMMTGAYPHLLQTAVGFIGTDLDGYIGPQTLAAVHDSEPVTLIKAMTGLHYRYLSELGTFSRFGSGWTTRLADARDAALELVMSADVPRTPPVA